MGNKIEKKEIETLLQGNGEFLYLPEGVWDAAASGELPLEEMILALPVSQWMVMVMVLESADSLENWDAIQTKLRTIRTREDIRYDYLDMHEANLLVSGRVRANTLEAAQHLLSFFAESNMRYARKLYTPETFTNAADLMPASIRAAVWVEKALQLDAAQHEQKLEYLRRAVEILPPMAELIRSYAVLFGQEEERKAKEAKDAAKELAQMAQEVKKQLGVLLEGGMYAEAYSVVQQLKTLLPNDAELITIEEELQSHFS
jgi:tetratricopeptide (TPR) repeat protein